MVAAGVAEGGSVFLRIRICHMKCQSTCQRLPEYMYIYIYVRMCQILSDSIPDRMSNRLPDWTPDRMTPRTPEHVSGRVSEYMSDELHVKTY